MKKLILVGGGGHCQSVIDVVETSGKYKIIGIVDRAERVGQRVSGYEIVGADDQLASMTSDDTYFLITVGQLDHGGLRHQLFQQVQQVGGLWATVVSANAYVSPRAKVGQGSVVMHRAVVNAHASVGENTIVNTGALVEHGVRVGNHCHIATGAIVNGDCRLADRVFVGSQATVIQGVSISSDIVVGAGAVVTRSLSVPGTYVGTPARSVSGITS